MSESAGTRVPEEVLAGILDELRGQDWNEPIASCASTCKYWAKMLRPTLFRYISLRSADDLDTLISFLRAPDPLDVPIGPCIEYLDINESIHSRSASWAHISLFKLRQLGISPQGIMLALTASSDSPPIPLPLAALPRPPLFGHHKMNALSLVNVHIPSMRGFHLLLRCLSPLWLELDGVTFSEKDLVSLSHPTIFTPPNALQRQKRPRSMKSRCLTGPNEAHDLKVWLPLFGEILFRGTRTWLDNIEISTLVAKYFHTARTFRRHTRQTTAWISIGPCHWDENVYYISTYYSPEECMTGENVIVTRDHLGTIRIGLDDFGADGVVIIFRQLCYELEKIDHKSQPMPHINFTCEDLANFETLLLHILEHPDMHGRPIFARSRLVWDMFVHNVQIDLQEALRSVPHTVVSPESRETFVLSSADRVTWLMLGPSFRSTWLDILLMDALGQRNGSSRLRTRLWADVRRAELLRVKIPRMYPKQLEDGVLARLGAVDVQELPAQAVVD